MAYLPTYNCFLRSYCKCGIFTVILIDFSMVKCGVYSYIYMLLDFYGKNLYSYIHFVFNSKCG